MTSETTTLPAREQRSASADDASEDEDVEFTHVGQGRDDMWVVIGGIAAGMAIIFLVLYFYAPPKSAQRFEVETYGLKRAP